jgi:DNA polymerase-1
MTEIEKLVEKLVAIADDASYVCTDADIDSYLMMVDDDIISVDTETSGFDPLAKDAAIRLIQIEANDKCVNFDIKFLNKKSRDKVAAFLSDPDKILIMQNAKFDIKWLKVHLGVKVHRIFDTMVASQLLSRGLVKWGHSLKAIVSHYFNHDLDKSMGASDWMQKELTPEQIRYASLDVVFLKPLRLMQIDKLKEQSQMEVANIEFRAIEPVAYMELCGIKLKRDRWERNANRNKYRAIRMEEKIAKILSPEQDTGMLFPNMSNFKVSSTKQLTEAMVKAGIEIPTMIVKGTQEEKSTIQVDYLEKIQDSHPAIPLIIKYSTLKKAHTSYGLNWTEKIHPMTGRIHPDIFQIGTETGRFAFKEPNLQQIPVENIYRNCFIPEDGSSLIGADYNAFELRIIAEASQDEAMIGAFNDGKDLHTYTASVVFRIPYEQMIDQKNRVEIKVLRTRAKNLNFGIVYGIGAKRFAKNANITEKEAYKIIDDYFSLYHGLKSWLDWAKREASQNRTSRTLAGRRYWHRFEANADYGKVAAAERLGCNFPIQGTNADIIKIALRTIYDELGDRVKLVNVIHDEIVIECQTKEAEEIQPIFVSCMERAGQTYIKSVPVIVEPAIMQRWGK